MDNVKTQSKTLKLACVVAFVLLVNIVIGIMAATGIAYAARPERRWGTGDLKVGDKITLSSQTWRVIQKGSEGTIESGAAGEETQGVLLALEDSIKGVFDTLGAESYRADEVFKASASLSYPRRNNGTNYLEEASIRSFLITEVLDKITEADVIATIPQQQIAWWGEARFEHPETTKREFTIGANRSDFEAAPNITGTNVVDAKPLDTGSIAISDSFVTSGSATIDAVAASENDTKVFRYTIDDQIFLPSINQVKLLKAAGITTDTLTRVPYASNEKSGSYVLNTSGNNVVAVRAYENLTTYAMTPMVYLDLNTVFSTASASDANGYRTFSGASNNKDEYGYSDVLVGDYMTIGGIRWRVIGKSSTNGFKLRVDRTLGTVQFDAARDVTPRPSGTLVDRPAINSIVSQNARSRAVTTIPGDNRRTTGSNFYWESDVRSYLTGEFLNNFLSYELAQINEVQQDLYYWWGDEVAEINTNGTVAAAGQGAYSAATASMYTDLLGKGGDMEGVAINQHFNRFVADSGLYIDVAETADHYGIIAPLKGREVPTLSARNAGIQTKDYLVNSIPFSNSIGTAFANVPSYTISDKVFLPSVADAYETNQLSLKNTNGSQYSQVLNASSGASEGYITSTPNIVQGNKEARIGSGIIGITAGGTGIYYGSATEDDDSLVPMMYLNYNTELDVVGSVALNKNETLQLRPTNVTNNINTDGYNTRRGWREFAIATNGTTPDNITEDDFAGATVAQAITNIQLSTAYEYATADLPDGMTINADKVLSWTPTTAGEVTFSIKTADGSIVSGDITVVVAAGRVVVSNAQNISGTHGGEMSNLGNDLIKADTKNMLGTTITGDWAWNPGQEDLPKDGATTGRIATFTPSGAFVGNYNAVQQSFTITLSDADLQGTVEGLINGRTLTAKYGQTLADILPALQQFVDGQTPTITASWAEGEEISQVGEYTTLATFKQENNSATLEVKVVVEAVPAEKPNMSNLKSNPTAVFGDTIAASIDYINADANWEENTSPNGDFVASDLTVKVGDAGNRTHTVTFNPSNSNLTSVDVEITITVTATERTEDQLTTIRVAVGKKLTDDKIQSGAAYSSITLPKGFSLAADNPTTVTGSVGDEVEINLVVGGKVKEDATEGAVENYKEATITAKFVIGEAPKDGSNQMALFIVLGIVGLAIVGGVVFFVLKKKQSAGSKF